MELRKRCTIVAVNMLPRQVGKTLGAELVNVVFPAPTTNWGKIDIVSTLKAMVSLRKAEPLRRAAKKRANKSRRANRSK